MVKAILGNKKTQTRRVIKNLPGGIEIISHVPEVDAPNAWQVISSMQPRYEMTCPYGGVGNKLWVRETHAIENNREYFGESPLPKDGRPIQHHHNDGDSYDLIPHYRATDPDPHIVPYDSPIENDDRTRWKPSIFMPRWASRITLEITDIRVQRIQEITSRDALSEGVNPFDKSDFPDPVGAFMELWNSINGTRQGRSFSENPYAWALSFRVLAQGGEA